jgi:membrane-associated phospholipid phosphatase
MARSMGRLFRKHPGLITIAILALVAMSAAATVDLRWTATLHDHRWPGLERWMNPSIFSGTSLSLNDLVIFFVIGALGVYLGGLGRSRTAKLRPQCGFIITSALVVGVYMVHGLKWIVGRARPYEVFNRGWEFTPWFSFGPHFVTEGIYYGSFPSGHTAQAFIIMSLAYILAYQPLTDTNRRPAGWIWGIIAMAFCMAMAAARCMSWNHWLSDTLGSIFMGWIVMHLLYFHVMKIPQQRRFVAAFGRLPVLPPVWEIVLCVYLLAGTVGLMMVLIGTKALIVNNGPWLVTMVPAGAAVIWFARQRSLSLLHTVWQAIDPETA